jgi:hypothetical protein
VNGYTKRKNGFLFYSSTLQLIYVQQYNNCGVDFIAFRQREVEKVLSYLKIDRQGAFQLLKDPVCNSVRTIQAVSQPG